MSGSPIKVQRKFRATVTLHWGYRLVFLCLFFILFSTLPPSVYASEPAKNVKIAVLSLRGDAEAYKTWNATAEYLGQAVPGYSFTIIPYDFKTIGPAAQRAEYDFVIANSSIYVELEALYGVTRIATLKGLDSGKAATLFGGVIFCKKDRDDINALNDVKGKTFVAVDETSFGGWRMAWREFFAAGIDPYRDFKKMEFAGTHDAVVYAVRDGKVDVGTARSGILESMAKEGRIKLDDFKIINQKSHDHFNVIHSTRLYPEWPFAQLPHTDDTLAQKVAVALLNMQPGDEGAKAAKSVGWTTPRDYTDVHELFKELKIGPYKEYGKITTGMVLDKYRYIIVGVFLFTSLLFVFGLFMLRVNRKLTNTNVELEKTHRELKVAQGQIEKAKREWEKTLDCISNMVLMCDVYGKIKRCNRPISELTGLEFVDILGKNWMSMLIKFGIQVVDFDGHHGHLFEPKNKRYFEVNVSPIREPGSPLQTGTVVSIHDTTALKNMNSKLEEAYLELQHTQSQILQQEKMASIGQLAAGVAHEINNPMGFISSNLSSLGKYMEKISTFNAALIEAVQSRGDSETLAVLNELRKKMKIDFILGDISDLLAESHDGADRVRRIVQDLKSFSHVDETECKPFSINECLSSTLNMARNEIKYVADVEEELDPDLPPLNCYPQQLNQVFMNILVNAAHAMEGHGTIKVKSEREANDIVVRISDSGKGIPAENLTRIFEPFFTTKEVGKGTGLGLSISYDIIKKHGGIMTVESEVGVGTTFIIRLPLNH
jgi:signal transduction histidine kinase/ABC-type phosphate/phosphonate transport system substrate-binding protein